MNRQIKVYIGDVNKFVGILFFNASGNRESSGLEYSSEWIESNNSFEIDPALPLNHGRAFRSKKERCSVFHGAPIFQLQLCSVLKTLIKSTLTQKLSMRSSDTALIIEQIQKNCGAGLR